MADTPRSKMLRDSAVEMIRLADLDEVQPLFDDVPKLTEALKILTDVCDQRSCGGGLALPALARSVEGIPDIIERIYSARGGLRNALELVESLRLRLTGP